MKRALKRVVQEVVAAAAPLVWRARDASMIVLMYHRVLPKEHPHRATEQPGMYVSPETFELQVRLLKQHFSVLHLDDWLDAVRKNEPLPRLACAITFDDGWRDNHQFAFPVLKRLGAPATVYLVADLVGTRYTFWPNMLAQLLVRVSPNELQAMPPMLGDMILAVCGPNPTSIDVDQCDRIINMAKAKCSDDQMLEMLRNSSSFPSNAERNLMDWAEISDWHREGLIRFGSHTRRHARLTKVQDTAELHDEIVGSRTVLQDRLGTAPRTFCYPNGDVSAPALKLVREHYLGAVTTEAGWNAAGCDIHCMRRVGVHEDVSSTAASFLSRLAGIG